MFHINQYPKPTTELYELYVSACHCSELPKSFDIFKQNVCVEHTTEQKANASRWYSIVFGE